jgi:hypothetical protein
VEERDERMRPPAEIVLRALLAGQEVWHEDFVYRIEEGQLRWRHRGSRRAEIRGGEVVVEDGEPPWFGCEMTVTGFLHMCEKFSRDDLFMMGASTALTGINRRGGARR